MQELQSRLTKIIETVPEKHSKVCYLLDEKEMMRLAVYLLDQAGLRLVDQVIIMQAIEESIDIDLLDG